MEKATPLNSNRDQDRTFSFRTRRRKGQPNKCGGDIPKPSDPGTDNSTPRHVAHRDHTYLNPAPTPEPRSSLDNSETISNSSIPRKGRPRKRRLDRSADHLYNTRKVDVSSKVPSYRDTDHEYVMKKMKTSNARCESKRDLDHMYVSKRESVEQPVVEKVNNRDTDHMYMLRKTGAKFACKSDKAPCSKKRERAVPKPEASHFIKGDKQVVDKDHMYQHNTRKTRLKRAKLSSKSDPHRKGLKVKIPAGKKRTENSANKPTGGDADCAQPSDTKSVSPSSVTVLESAHALMSIIRPSPEHSETDSEQVYEDDSRRIGISHTDHMYVHADYLDNESNVPILSSCCSAEGYKIEHSYANSEETHYDACINCSELVQQLIGTIRQQREQIEDLKKQLKTANDRVKNV